MNNQAKTDENKAILTAFSWALGREAHVLTQHLALLWQQMYNRLQWDAGQLSTLAAAEWKA